MTIEEFRQGLRFGSSQGNQQAPTLQGMNEIYQVAIDTEDIAIEAGKSVENANLALATANTALEQSTIAVNRTENVESVVSQLTNPIDNSAIADYTQQPQLQLTPTGLKAVALRGVPGPQGERGLVGAQGIQGSPGEQGERGLTGARGERGETGNGVVIVDTLYQASTSATTAPTGPWIAAIPPMAPGSFLWTRTETSMTDGNTYTTFSVARQGRDGAHGATGPTGDGIVDIVTDYQASTSATTAPNGPWLTTIPPVAQGSFLWTRNVTIMTNGIRHTAFSVARQGRDGMNGGTGGNGGEGGLVRGVFRLTEIGRFSSLNTPLYAVLDERLHMGMLTVAQYISNYDTIPTEEVERYIEAMLQTNPNFQMMPQYPSMSTVEAMGIVVFMPDLNATLYGLELTDVGIVYSLPLLNLLPNPRSARLRVTKSESRIDALVKKWLSTLED